MELLSIVLARASLLCETGSLDPFGRMSSAEVFTQIKDRYSFVFVPQRSGENADPDKGIEFGSGRLGEIVIDKLTVFTNGIVVDTRSSTDNSEAIASDLLAIATELLGSKVVVERRHFANQITFRSQMNLAKMNPVLSEICEDIERSMAVDFKQSFVAEPVGVIITTDTTQTRFAPTKFTIERRADTPFFENIYFSNSPFRTARHLEWVEKFERSIL